MSNQTLKQAILEVLAEIAPETEIEAIAPDASFREQLDIDSMDFLNFMIGLHDRFNLDIPEVDYPKLSTLNSAISYLQAKKAGEQTEGA